MVSFGGILGGIGDIIQKPQSVFTGAMSELTGTNDELRNFMDKYEYGLVDDTSENAQRYELAKSTVGDAGGGTNTGDSMINKLFRGAQEGVENSIRPSDISIANGTDNGILNPVGDVLVDPVNLIGGSAGKLPGVAGELATAAGTFGKLGEGAGKAEKAAQAARYLYQGAMAGGGNPMLGLGISALMPVGERALGNVAGRLLAKTGTQIAEDIVGQGTETAMSRSGLESLLAGDVPIAQNALGRGAAGELMPGPGPARIMEPTRAFGELPAGPGPARAMGPVPKGMAVEPYTQGFPDTLQGIDRVDPSLMAPAWPMSMGPKPPELLAGPGPAMPMGAGPQQYPVGAAQPIVPSQGDNSAALQTLIQALERQPQRTSLALNPGSGQSSGQDELLNLLLKAARG